MSKVATPPSAIEAAQADLDAAEARLAVLRAEQDALPRCLETATQVVDLDEVFRLRERQDRLPTELRAARVVLVQVRQRLLEAQRDDPARAVVKVEAFGKLDAATAQLQAAQEAVTAAQTAVAHVRETEQDLNRDIAGCKIELEQLRAQLAAAGDGPVVRARFLARGA